MAELKAQIKEFMVLLRKYPDFGIIVGDQLIRQLSGTLLFVGLQWYIVSHGFSSVVLGMAVFLTAVPEFLFSWITGKIVDSYSIKHIVLVTNLINSILVFLLWIALHFHHTEVFIIYFFSFLYGCVESIQAPVFLSYLPRRMDDADYYRANQILSVALNMVSAFAPAFVGLIIAKSGSVVSFFYATFLFLASAVLSLLLRNINFQNEIMDPDHQTRTVMPSVRNVLGNKDVLSLILLRFLGNFGYAPFEVLLVLWVNKVMHAGPQTLGVMFALLSIGSILGSVSVNLVNKLNPSMSIFLLNLLLGVLLSTFLKLHSIVIASIVVFIIGMILTSDQILVDLFYQRTVPKSILGRVASLRIAFGQGATTFGQIASGWMAGVIGASMTIGFGGVLVIFSGVVFYVLRNKKSMYTEARTED